MIIIDGKKDYYDYLTGIYGVDPKLILDRRRGVESVNAHHSCIIICGRVVEIYEYKNEFYFGDRLDEILNLTRTKYFSVDYQLNRLIENRKKASPVIVDFENLRYDDYRIVCKEIYDDPFNLNVKFECPIIKVDMRDFNRLGSKVDYCESYINLKDMGLASIVTAEKIYSWLSTWLGEQVERRMETNIVSTDKQKLVNKGFDVKSSFRPNMK